MGKMQDPEDKIARGWGFTDRLDVEYIAAKKAGIVREAELIVAAAEEHSVKEKRRAYRGVQRWKHRRRERLVAEEGD